MADKPIIRRVLAYRLVSRRGPLRWFLCVGEDYEGWLWAYYAYVYHVPGITLRSGARGTYRRTTRVPAGRGWKPMKYEEHKSHV